MTTHEIKSDRVRAIITGSATPWQDLCAETLTPSEYDEAQKYAYANHRIGMIQLASFERGLCHDRNT